MPKLNEVFGIRASRPVWTYVDRANLDARLKHLLDSERHVVIHGESKQGKTVLRDKLLPGDRCVVVSCGVDHTVEDVFAEIHRQLRTRISREATTETTRKRKNKASVGLKVKLPGGEVGSQVSGELEVGHAQSETLIS